MTKNKAATYPDSKRCATRYPILLVHGVGVRDGKKHRIWGRIPQTLRKHGADIYFGNHDAWGTTENNAVQLLERIPTILAQSGATKINIIAHSKGGLDARALIALFPEDELPIASLTTIATPHQGSKSIELLLALAEPAFVPISRFANKFYRMLGDANPDFLAACRQLRASYWRYLNEVQPGLPPLYSQQFSSRLHGCFDDLTSLGTYPLISLIEGPNDGLVALHSAVFDNYRGTLSTKTGRGIGHALMVDSLMLPFSLRKPPYTSYAREAAFAEGPEPIPLVLTDIVDFYIALVADLKARGL